MNSPKYNKGIPIIIQQSDKENPLIRGGRNKKNNKGMYKVYIENKKLNIIIKNIILLLKILLSKKINIILKLIILIYIYISKMPKII